MRILVSFTPWFLFWIFALHKEPSVAAISGFLAVAAIIIANIRQGYSVKSLQSGSMVFFLLFALAIPIFGRDAVARNVDLLGNSGVLIIVLLTIIIKRPFSLEFARERVDKKYWQEPRFIRLNYFISLLWLATLLVNFDLVLARHFSIIEIDRRISVAIRILNCILAMVISQWYIKHRFFMYNEDISAIKHPYSSKK
jgi:hypothetical protein